jgi:hypothetical protein
MSKRGKREYAPQVLGIGAHGRRIMNGKRKIEGIWSGEMARVRVRKVRIHAW